MVRHVFYGFELLFQMSSVRKDGVENKFGIISREKPVISLRNRRLTNLVIDKECWDSY